MKVLFVNHTVQIGGAEVSLVTLIEGLCALGCHGQELAVAVPSSGPLTKRLNSLGVEVFHIPGLERFKRTWSPLLLAKFVWGWLVGSRALALLVRRFNPDILHFNSASALLYALGMRRRSGSTPRMIWHARDLVAYGMLCGPLFKCVDSVIAISETVAEHLSAQGCPGAKLVIIDNPVDAEPFLCADGASVRAEWNVSRNALLFGMVGQIVPWKQHDVLIRAAAIAVRQLPATARFVIVGTDMFGDHQGYAARLHRLLDEAALSTRFIWAGYRTDMANVMAAIDVLVHPTKYEPFGRSVVEAMASGKAVVVAGSGGVSEFVEHQRTGLVLKSAEPEALAAVMVSVAENVALRVRLGKAAQDLVRERFHSIRCAKQVVQLWERS